MKLLLILSLFAWSSPDYWIRNLERRMETFNAESKLVKQRGDTTSSDYLMIRKYKSRNLKKICVTGKSEGVDTLGISYYSKRRFIYAHKEFLIARYPQKGKIPEDQPTTYIEESHYYYKNKKEGVLFSRSIAYNENADLDSLKYELSTMKFDTLDLRANNYKSSKKRWKSAKKKC